jgi:hypothetical protein
VPFFRIVTDSIGRLEGRSTHVGDVLKELMMLKREFVRVATDTPDPNVRKFREYTIKKMIHRAKPFKEDLFVVGLFLLPHFRKFVNSFLDMKEIKRKCLVIVRRILPEIDWAKATALAEQIGRYAEARFNTSESMDNIAYWEREEDYSVLKRLALSLLRTPVHSASVERLFSCLGLTHTKTRNRLAPKTLKKLGTVAYDLKDVAATKTRNLGAVRPSVTTSSSSNTPYSSSDEDNISTVFMEDILIQIASPASELEGESDGMTILEEVSVEQFLAMIDNPDPFSPFENALLDINLPDRGSTTTVDQPEDIAEADWDVDNILSLVP